MNRQVLLKTPRGHTASVMLQVPQNTTSTIDDGEEKMFMMQQLWDAVRISYGATALDANAATATDNQQDLPIQYWHATKHVASASDLIHLLQQHHQPLYLTTKLAIRGGIDRQNRVGSKFGGGGVSSSQQAQRERQERLRQLALESVDLAKDPYLMRNHLGTYECKLCLTLHTNEANYLAHTQGKKHQEGLARRAHMEKLKQELEVSAGTLPQSSTGPSAPKRTKVRIGRPAYQVFKSRDAETNQRCLSFEVSYPSIDEGLQPRHRFMSAFEQKVEAGDRRYQYLLFAADPYETIAFKIPNDPIDQGPGRFVTHWDGDDTKKFTLTLYFDDEKQEEAKSAAS